MKPLGPGFAKLHYYVTLQWGLMAIFQLPFCTPRQISSGGACAAMLLARQLASSI